MGLVRWISRRFLRSFMAVGEEGLVRLVEVVVREWEGVREGEEDREGSIRMGSLRFLVLIFLGCVKTRLPLSLTYIFVVTGRLFKERITSRAMIIKNNTSDLRTIPMSINRTSYKRKRNRINLPNS